MRHDPGPDRIQLDIAVTEVHVIGHRAVRVDLATALRGLFGQMVEVKAVVLVRVETRAMIAALNQMQRDSGNGQARSAWHGRSTVRKPKAPT